MQAFVVMSMPLSVTHFKSKPKQLLSTAQDTDSATSVITSFPMDL